MIAVLCILVASAFVCPSRAVTIALPNKIKSGTSVTVQWTRDDADPLSFGLMQRSLEGNNPVLSVTAVTNDAGVVSGIASVLFNTPGQVLLAVISQPSLAPDETPNQLFAGTQVTVTRGTRGSSGPGVDTGTVPTPLPAVTTTTLTAVSIHTISSITTASIVSPSTALAPATKSSTSREGISSSLPSEGPIPPPTSSFTGYATAASATAAPSLSLTAASPKNSTSGGTASAARARKRGMPRAAVIALAVLLPLLALLLCIPLCCCCRARRRPTRHRISQFSDFFLRAHAARELDREAARDPKSDARAPAQPVVGGPAHVPPTPSPAPPSPPSPRWHQKVAYLAAHNAILQRGLLARSLPSARVSVGEVSVDGEPPPVYVESEDARSLRPPQRR